MVLEIYHSETYTASPPPPPLQHIFIILPTFWSTFGRTFLWGSLGDVIRDAGSAGDKCHPTERWTHKHVTGHPGLLTCWILHHSISVSSWNCKWLWKMSVSNLFGTSGHHDSTAKDALESGLHSFWKRKECWESVLEGRVVEGIHGNMALVAIKSF